MAVNKEPRINLLRYQQEEVWESKSNIRFLLILGLVALLFVSAMGGTWRMQSRQLQELKAQNEQLQQQVSELTSATVSTDIDSEISDKIKARATMVQALEKQIKVKSKYFEDVYLLSIPGVTIGKMDVKPDNNFAMSAYCSSQAKLIKYLEQLINLDFVKEVKSITSKRNAKTGEVNFNITLVWEEVK
jgi:Tfp pilus assembly protein PilN